MPKYTVHGNSSFDTKIEKDMQIIAESVSNTIPQKYIRAIVLAGGYGRGEGGVKFSEEKMELFNDYDMFFIAENIKHKLKKQLNTQLQQLSHSLTEKIGIDVDFGPILTVSQLENLSFCIMFYELKYGSTVIYGDTNVTDLMPEYKHSEIPLIEAVNLMLNRGTGLIFCKEKIKKNNKTSEDIEFIERNINKAFMAAGDSILIYLKQYHYSYVKRLNIVTDTIIFPEGFEEVLESYKKSLIYKLKPHKLSGNLEEELSSCIKFYEKVYFFIISALIDNKSEMDSEIYRSKLTKYIYSLHGDNIIKVFKNIILNILYTRHFKIRMELMINYPRLRLLLALPYILFNKDEYRLLANFSLGFEEKNQVEYSKLYLRFINLWERFR